MWPVGGGMRLAHGCLRPTSHPMNPARGISDMTTTPATTGIEVDSDVFELVNGHRSADADLVPGAQICENIRLISMLGAGGMGNGGLAHHAGLETHVAVKFMASEVACDTACMARFATEAKLAA